MAEELQKRTRKLSRKERGRRGGRVGGRAQVPKGFARLSEERRREISQLAVEARRRKKEQTEGVEP